MSRNLRAPVCLIALILLLPTAPLLAQNGLANPGSLMRRAQDALLRGDRVTAARLIGEVVPPPPAHAGRDRVLAQKALLLAGCAEDAERIGRYLAVAGTQGVHQEALTALIASLHLIQMGIEGDSEFEPGTPEAEDGPNALTTHLGTCRELLAPWVARLPEDPRVKEALRLLESAAADGSPLHPGGIRLTSHDRLPVVTPLAEPLLVRWYARSSESQSDRDIREGTATPLDEQTIAADTSTAPLVTPVGGAYVLEVRSPSGWRVLRRVVLTDLDLAYQATPEGVAILATHDGRPMPGVDLVIETTDTHPIQIAAATTGRNGTAVIPIKEPSGSLRIRGRLSTPDGGLHRCASRLSLPSRRGFVSRWTTHVMVDRPLYRPGETVQGRIVVRSHDEERAPAAVGHLSTPTTRPAGNLDLDLHVTLPGNKKSTLRLKTDAFGVATFETVIPESSALGSIRYQFKHGTKTLVTSSPASVSAFKRPPILVTLKGPSTWTIGDQAPRAVVSATWPWGTPAAGLAGTVRATISRFPHETRFTTDANGRATIDLDLPGLSALRAGNRVSAAVNVTSADGQVVRNRWSLSVTDKPRNTPVPPPLVDSSRVTVKGPGRAVTAGDAAEIVVTGPAGAAVLLTVARETLIEARSIVLPTSGRTTVTLETQPNWTPHVSVAVTLPRPTGSYRQSRWNRGTQTRIQVRRPELAMKVALERDRDIYGPGDDSNWTIVTRDGSGRPTSATVAIAVVDDTLFQLARDRTGNPVSTLLPRWWRLALYHGYGPVRGDPWRGISELLWLGRVPKPTWQENLNGAIGVGGGASLGSGGRGGRGGGGSSTRTDFRATAHWIANLRTDANGKGTFAFKFPDDLTTWRLTAAVVDAGRGGALHVERVRTEKPIATEAILPRLMRQGDRLEIPVQVAQARGEAFDARVSAEARGGAHVIDGSFMVRTEPSKSVSRHVTVEANKIDNPSSGVPTTFTSVVARAPGDAPLDRATRKMPVISRDIERTSAITSIVRGTSRMAPEAIPGTRPRGIDIEVLGSLDAVLAQASEYLTGYPWGCAEQTTSRLVPIMVAAHARLSGRKPGDARLTPLQAHRLEIGMARLRELQRADGGFGWWDGDRTDPGISAMVLRTLALMQDAEMDPNLYRVRHSPDLELLQQASTACGDDSGEDDVGPFPRGAIRALVLPGGTRYDADARRALAAVELAVTRVLIGGRDEAALAPLEGLLTHAEQLPLGLIARAGRAFALAGLEDRALRLLSVVRRRIEFTGGIGSGPGIDESAAIRSAAVLELVLAVAPKDPLKDRVIAELLRLNRAGRMDHTAGSAAGIIALSRLRAVEPGSFIGSPTEPFTVTVTCRGPNDEPVSMERELGPEEGFRGSWTFDGVVGPVTIEAPKGRFLVATAVARFATDGTAVAPWATPLAITRRLFIVTRDQNGRETRRLATNGDVAVGDLLEAELEISGPPDSLYLLAQCPLPAGFEALRSHHGVVIHDHRVARGLSHLVDGRRQVTFRMIPGLRGKVAWPAARVEAMYRPEHTGGTSGAWLTVGKRRPLAGPAGATELLGAAWARARLDDLIDKIARSTDDDDSALTSRHLYSLARLPDERAAAWLFNAAPRALGSEFTDTSVMTAWMKSLGSAAEERLSGGNLAELFTTAAPPPDAETASDAYIFGQIPKATSTGLLIRALAHGMESSSQTFHEWRPEAGQTVLERRLYALTCLLAGEYPDHATDSVTRTRILSRWLRALDVEPGSRDYVIVERRAAIQNRGGNRQITQAFDDVLEDRWRRLHLGHDAGKPEHARAVLVELVTTVADAFEAARRSDRRDLAVTLLSMLSGAEWPEKGAAEPEEHVALRRDLAKIHDRVRQSALDAFLDQTEDRWDNGRATLTALLQLAVGSDPNRIVEITSSYLPRFADNGALDAGETLLAAARTARSRARLRPVLLRILSQGPRQWWPHAWSVLTEKDQAAVPDDVILKELKSAGHTDSAVRAAISRPSCRSRVLALLPRLSQNEQVTILGKLDWKPEELRPLGLEAMFTFREALEDHWNDEETNPARTRLTALLRHGPWQSELVARVARPADHDDRAWMMRALAPDARVSWNRDADPAADFWRTLFESRRGHAASGTKVRAWIRSGREHRLAAQDRHILWWALEPHLTAMDLVHADDLKNEVPPTVIERTLLAATTEELLTILDGTLDDDSSIDGSTVLAWLPGPAAARLTEAALTYWIGGADNEPCLSVLKSTPNSTLVAALIRRVATLPEETASTAFLELDGFAEGGVPERKNVTFELASRAITQHPSAKIREQSARLLYARTGAPHRWTDADGRVHQVGPRSLGQRTSDLRKRARRTGASAVTSALASDDPSERVAARVVLSRWGLLLTPPR